MTVFCGSPIKFLFFPVNNGGGSAGWLLIEKRWQIRNKRTIHKEYTHLKNRLKLIKLVAWSINFDTDTKSSSLLLWTASKNFTRCPTISSFRIHIQTWLLLFRAGPARGGTRFPGTVRWSYLLLSSLIFWMGEE